MAAVKNLDSMTKDLIIPSRSGSNIINSLTVSYLLFLYWHMTFINHSINKIKIIVINKKIRLSSLNSGSLNTFNKQI